MFFKAKNHILCHCLDRHQHKVLMDHAHASRDGIAGHTETNLLAIDIDLAAIGVVESRQYVHQRRLASSVLAEQGMDLPLLGDKGDIFIGNHTGKELGDVAHFKGGRWLSH
jgi:hypothetical protein